MNKIIMLALSMLMYGFAATGQITKGNWMVGGNFSYSRQNSSGNDATNSIYRIIDIEANGGYFFYDKIAAGINLNTIFSKTKVTGREGASVQNNYSAGSFMRYYFLHAENRINLFAGAGASYLFHTSESNGNNMGELQSLSYSFSAGTVIFLNTSVGVECLLAYNNTDVLKFDIRNEVFQFKIGLQIHLKKE